MKSSIAGLLALSFVIVACGDDSNSSAPERGGDSARLNESIVETFDDLLNCNDKREGLFAYVKEEQTAYYCKNRRWEKFNDENTDFLSGSLEDVSSSSNAVSSSSVLNSSSVKSSLASSTSKLLSSSSRVPSSSSVQSSSSVANSSSSKILSSSARLSSSSSVKRSSSSSLIAVSSSSQKVSSSSVPEEPKVLIDSRDG